MRKTTIWLALAACVLAAAPSLFGGETGVANLTAALTRALDSAAGGNADSLALYAEFDKALTAYRTDQACPISAPEDLVDAGRRLQLWQLQSLHDVLTEAERHAASALSNPDFDEDAFNEFVDRIDASSNPRPELAEAAREALRKHYDTAAALAAIRHEALSRFQEELRREKVNPGTRMAWGLLRAAMADPDTRVVPSSFRIFPKRAELAFVMDGVRIESSLGADDYENRIRATANGYEFTAGWAVLFQKPLRWMARMAADMKAAGVDPALYPSWEVMEGPGGILALAGTGEERNNAPSKAFFRGALLDAASLPTPADARRAADDFVKAAKALHDGVMNDESIPRQLRMALKPVLMGAYQKPDPRDYFDSAFCRRLIEADYLETFISPMAPERLNELETYRAALGRLEAGYDAFVVALPDGSRLAAVAAPETGDLTAGPTNDRDLETGETVPRFVWRVEGNGETAFFSPLPARQLYALSLAEYYPGKHTIRPAGSPARAEVWHPLVGRLTSYAVGDDKAAGDADKWAEAILADRRGGRDASIGAAGWNFPPHVLLRDDQGDPVLLATLGGVVPSPDFSGIPDMAERRRAEDEWLDHTAKALSAPGELGLIFHQFFRYCSDSPLPEKPNLIGSHFGLSDTHQTVYESLERRWVGRLIGDCDDLAEFFQVLTARQGKLSHVMQLPGHAACGYVERTDDGQYRFVVLQTGPVVQFTAPTLYGAVETAYRSFDDEGGRSHITAAAVPLLLRFADEETRTPFVLSARIYEDREYAETMIRVQGYWHQHVYSAAIGEMEEIIAEDREVGNLKELGSLYERVGEYEKSARLRREELDAVGDDYQARLSTLLDIAGLHIQDRKEDLARQALDEAEALMRGLGEEEFQKTMAFRASWAVLQSRLGRPARAWDLLKTDVEAIKELGGRLPDTIVRILVVVHDKMALNRETGSRSHDTGDGDAAMAEVEREIEENVGGGYFKATDNFPAALRRYFVIGRYAVAKEGRKTGVDRLKQDGPYPDGTRDHARRGKGVSDEDWKWFRIVPQLYLAVAQEMLDKDEYPELYDPEAAKPLLEDVGRAVEKGTGLGSDVIGGDDVIRSALILSFINRDLASFDKNMEQVKEKDYASIYDDAALAFGLNCGLVPLSEFPAWIESFHRYFPGKQHYFKVVYRAIDKENYDHAAMLAEATAGFFPEDRLLVEEAEFVKKQVPELKRRKAERDAEGQALEERPAA